MTLRRFNEDTERKRRRIERRQIERIKILDLQSSHTLILISTLSSLATVKETIAVLVSRFHGVSSGGGYKTSIFICSRQPFPLQTLVNHRHIGVTYQKQQGRHKILPHSSIVKNRTMHASLLSILTLAAVPTTLALDLVHSNCSLSPTDLLYHPPCSIVEKPTHVFPNLGQQRQRLCRHLQRPTNHRRNHSLASSL